MKIQTCGPSALALSTTVPLNALNAPLPVFYGVDFVAFVTMDDELGTCVGPNTEAIFNDLLSAVKHSKDSKIQKMDGRK